MPEQEQDLFQFSSGEMTQPRAGPAKVVWGEGCYPGPSGRSLHHMPYRLKANVFPPNHTVSVNGAKDETGRN